MALFLAERGTTPVAGGRAFKHDPVHVTRGPYPFRLEQWTRYWRAIRCPVLLVEGEQTELPPPPDMAERVACLRDAARCVVPGAGHMMMRHEPGGGGLGDPGVPPGGVADQPEDDDDPEHGDAGVEGQRPARARLPGPLAREPAKSAGHPVRAWSPC